MPRMQELPARETLKRLGGINAVARALGTSTGTVHAWTEEKAKKSDTIPRWWYESIKALAAREGVTLPKPLPKAAKPRKRKVAA